MTLRNCSEEGYKLDVLLLGSYLGGHCCIYHQLDNPKHELELWLNVIEQPGTYQTYSHIHKVQGKLTSSPPEALHEAVRQASGAPVRNMGPIQIPEDPMYDIVGDIREWLCFFDT